MKLLHILALGGLLAASTSAFADTLSGSVGVGGADSFNTTQITFNGAGVVTSTTLASTTTGLPVLTFLEPVTFVTGSLTYNPGGTYSTPLLFATSGSVQYYVTSETFTPITTASQAGTLYDTLTMSGTGYFLYNGTQTAATYSITSTEKTGTTTATIAGSFGAVGNVAATPEPSSLLLLGSGLVGTAGMLFRRRRSNMVA